MLQSPILFPPTSSRARKSWPPVIDEVANKHAHRVRFNLGVGTPFFGPASQVVSNLPTILGPGHNSADLSRYGDILGDEKLRQLWANVLVQGYNGYVFDETKLKPLDEALPHHELMITAGANQAFMNVVLALCDSGDEVLLILPYYFSHFNALVMTDVRPVFVPVEKTSFMPKIQDIKKRFTTRSRALVIVNPANPSSIVYPKELLERIASLCREQGIWLIIDEAYREFAYDSPTNLTYSPSAEDGIINIYTASKAYGMAGWRIGAVKYPKRLSPDMKKSQDTIPTHAARFSELVALENLKYNPVSNSRSRSHIAELNEVRLVLTRALSKVYKNSSLEGLFVVPNGAYYFFVPYKTKDGEPASKESDTRVVDYLAEKHGVLVTPGFTFGMCGYVRLSYGCVRLSRAEELADVLAAGLKALVS